MKHLKPFNENNNMTEQEELVQVNSQIEKLKLRKAELEKVISSKSDDFFVKFRLWYNNDNPCLSDWLPDRGSLLRKAFDDQIDEPRRGKTYDICDIIGEDEFEAIINPDFYSEYGNKWFTEEKVEEVKNKWKPLLQYCMENKIKAFKADW